MSKKGPADSKGMQGKGMSPAIPGSEGKIKGSSPPLKERSEDAGAVPAASTVGMRGSGLGIREWRRGPAETSLKSPF